MNIGVDRIVGWEHVLDGARTTVGKEDRKKDPSDEFKKSILISEHSPIRYLTYEIIYENMPYWVSMHFRTHHIGFKSGSDDLYFIQTQRTDRTQVNRDELPQDAPVRLRVVANAHSILNISRVRLCRSAMKETREAWEKTIEKLAVIEPVLANLCQPNCIYRGFCPEGQRGCGFEATRKFEKGLNEYREFCRCSSIRQSSRFVSVRL